MNYSEWRATARYFNFKGHRIAYYLDGDGPTITLVHGFPTSSHDWCKIWPLLKSDYRLVAVDLIGFGASAKPRPYDYTFFEQAEMIEALWRELGVEQTLLVAHDYGSTVALELLARQKEAGRSTVQKAILLNGGIVQGAYQPRIIQRLLASRIGPLLGIFLGRGSLARNFRAIFGPAYQLTEAEINDFWAGINEQNGKWALPYIGRYLHQRQTYAERWSSTIAKPGVPLHYFWGLFDPISGQAVYEGLKELNPAASGVEMEQVGHYPQWEEPERLVDLIRDVS